MPRRRDPAFYRKRWKKIHKLRYQGSQFKEIARIIGRDEGRKFKAGSLAGFYRSYAIRHNLRWKGEPSLRTDAKRWEKWLLIDTLRQQGKPFKEIAKALAKKGGKPPDYRNVTQFYYGYAKAEGWEVFTTRPKRKK